MNKKLGYYSIGVQTFESKIEACVQASKIVKDLDLPVRPRDLVKWHFNDEIFDHYNWTIEPEESLQNLYYQRAKHIREHYDYVILSYSGGADSHNALMSFLDQGLHVDELVVTHMNKAMDKYAIVDPNHKESKYSYSSEYYLQISPRLRDIYNRMPSIKITILDVSDSVFEAFAKHRDESWIFHVREELNPVDASRYNYLQFPSFKKQLDLDKKICIVLGVDKPKVRYDNTTNKFYFSFVDRLANITPIGEYAKDYTNTTIEYFYWSPDACDLLCKQAHTIANHIISNPHLKSCFLPTIYTNYERSLVLLLYAGIWDSSWFQADKCVYDWYSEYDHWFLERYRNSVEYSLWNKGLQYIYKNCADFIVPYGALIRFDKKYIFKDG